MTENRHIVHQEAPIDEQRRLYIYIFPGISSATTSLLPEEKSEFFPALQGAKQLVVPSMDLGRWKGPHSASVLDQILLHGNSLSTDGANILARMYADC